MPSYLPVIVVELSFQCLLCLVEHSCDKFVGAHIANDMTKNNICPEEEDDANAKSFPSPTSFNDERRQRNRYGVITANSEQCNPKPLPRSNLQGSVSRPLLSQA